MDDDEEEKEEEGEIRLSHRQMTITNIEIPEYPLKVHCPSFTSYIV